MSSDMDTTREERQAIQVDPTTGIRQEVAFFGSGQLRKFGCTHHPAGSAIAGVVVCPPLQSEFLVNYRREFVLARSLALRGFAVQRFHYRGTGHSDGDSSNATFSSMRADAAEAATWLTELTGVSRVAFVGARWGGLIAAAAASDVDGAPLALWEPVVDGSRYFREVFRTLQIQGLSQGRPAKPTADIVEDLRRVGTLDVLGFAIDLPLYESSTGHALIDELGHRPRAVLVIQIDRTDRLRLEYADLVARWQGMGFAVDTHLLLGQEAWWFREWRQDREMSGRGELLAQITADWIAARFAEGET